MQDRRTAFSTGLFGALMLLGAVVIIVDATRLPDESSAMGPAAMPVMVAVLLGAVGIGLLVQAKIRLPGAPRAELPGAWWRVVALVAVLLAFALLLPLVGYVLTATGLFVGAALLLGAPRRWVLLAYGWALAAAVFFVFDRLIGLSLPSGPWGF
ncbi:tripartite tricarboxylate transporter TctB family protein [Saccharopolyspora endophytica]|uniref:Tripartite tricarboxylate transporter TctB family protein n=1 Tax=Saccharopolyspora endophytica TaxID=543886 RepID=A0ABS5DBL1_9PSEU|nr:tripartite tricarboxylate transporter TctB family protein [Saccharopolyspora endophytica]MBQ0923678.1 tripartite tricarboxylate transporter TctB family protein [Saccharopolyspora endophytica]